MRHPDVHVVSKPDAMGDRSLDHLGWEEAVRLLPHQQKAVLGRCFKLKAIRKVEVRIEKNQFLAGVTYEQRIGDLAPARMTAAECAQMIVPGEERFLPPSQILLRVDRPSMRLGIDRLPEFQSALPYPARSR